MLCTPRWSVRRRSRRTALPQVHRDVPGGILATTQPPGCYQVRRQRLSLNERRGRDLNPRGSYKPPTRLAGERLRPLGHLSYCPASVSRLLPALAEGVGFEPTRGGHPQRHFQCRALDQTMRSLHTRNVDRLRKRSVRPRTLATGSSEAIGEYDRVSRSLSGHGTGLG